jgi:hypothetical protein
MPTYLSHNTTGQPCNARYGTACTLHCPQKRLSVTHDGKVRLKLRKPLPSGRTAVVFEPVEFVRPLAASLPPPILGQSSICCLVCLVGRNNWLASIPTVDERASVRVPCDCNHVTMGIHARGVVGDP